MTLMEGGVNGPDTLFCYLHEGFLLELASSA